MDIRSVVPSQLIAESGSDLIVINLGSATLRIGLATRQSPVVIPHCIAHRLLVSMDDGVREQMRKKGSVAEQGFSTNSMSGARRVERDEICQMVESQLKMRPFIPDQEGSPKVHGEGWSSVQLGEDDSFPWTHVLVKNPVSQHDVTVGEPLIITNSAVEDGLHSATTHSPEVLELGSGQEHEQKVGEESQREIPKVSEQEFVEDSNEPTPIEPDEEIAEDSEEETRKEPEEEVVEDSDEEAQKESEALIVEDSEEETRKEPAEEIVEDSEDDAQKASEAAIQELFDTETPRESEAAIQELFDTETPKESEPAIQELFDRETPIESEAAIQELFDRETPRESEQESPTEPEQEVHEGSDLEIHVEVRLEPEDTAKSNIQTIIHKPVRDLFKYRKYICGEEALNIAASEPYILRRPICRGHLNITQHYSLQQVCDDLYSIWDWVLTEKLLLESKIREQFSAVLVVPDTLDNREIKELLSVVLRDLHFRSAVVHQESVAATFGNGISSACVVNMGAQVTSVVCVEDGVALPTTRIILPFGGEDISRCLLWVQQRWQAWPPIDTDPVADPLDLHILEHIKEDYCLIIEGDQSAVIEIPYHEGGRPSLLYKGSLTALNVPVMGLFYPSLLAPEEYAAPMRPGFHTDHEDVLDDSFHVETSRKSDVAEVVLPPVSNGGASLVAGSLEVVADDTIGSQGRGPEESTLGLSRAIVNSIMSTGRPDLQKKLFASIQLVGGTAYIRGLVDAVEERVLHDIPAHEAVDTVAVLQNRTEAPTACWKGGAVLGILDFSRDAWVHHDDWVTGGVRRGCGRKYKDSYTLHSQAFYYSATVE